MSPAYPFIAATRLLRWLVFASASLALVGCARMSDTAKNLFVSSTPAVAIVGGRLLQGDLQVYSDDSGFLALASEPLAAPLQCSGRLPTSSSFGREIYLRCSNGNTAHLRLSMRTDLRGYAYGGEGDAATSLAFGLDAAESTALLTVPKGMVLGFADGKYSLRKESVPLPPAEAAGSTPKPEEPAAKPAVVTSPVSRAEVAPLPLGDQVAAKFGEWSQQLRKWVATSTPMNTAMP